MAVKNSAPFTATVLGLPRIGPKRELKRAVEAYWAGRTTADELHAIARDLRQEQYAQLRASGLDSIPVGTFSYYDHMLDTAEMLGALPARVSDITDPLDRYFAAARGTAQVEPLEMTKWFDTNYHYLVPEIGPDTTFSLHPEKLLAQVREALDLEVPVRAVVIGPLTFLALAKSSDASTWDRIDELIGLYQELLAQLAAEGVAWVQIDEPALVTDLTAAQLSLAQRVYTALSEPADRPAILVATYFGAPEPALDALAATDIEGVAVDFVSGTELSAVAQLPALATKLVVAGVVDGRNVWRADLDTALSTLATLLGCAGEVAVSSSCSLLHVPYSLAPETALDPTLLSWLAFGAEKVAEVGVLARGLRHGADSISGELAAAHQVAASRRTDARRSDPDVQAALAALTPESFTRTPAEQRRELQSEQLNLPALPTTTIGSYPQTSAIRVARAARRAGDIDQAEYVRRMRAEIAEVISWQESLGLDVLVHGEPERNDMVQYFAEQLAGFATTEFGWVQSYGTRCVRPPILYGDVSRPAPMTVDWIDYAQSLTEKPVKGMLTGPVTILAWSFVRDDQPLADTARQVAWAIRQETLDLERGGARIIQVDEPALRELLPLRAAERPEYLRWSVEAFRLATAGVSDKTQIHTHLCYSEFGAVIDAIAELDADVTSIEAARSHMEVLTDLANAGFALGVGPGVYDIHSPRVPSPEEIKNSLSLALAAVPPERLWVNPDCGLKTRAPQEVTAALTAMVTATRAARSRLG